MTIAPMQPIPPMMPQAPQSMGGGGALPAMGIPPLNLSQGPSTALATSDGTQTGSNSGTATSGDFVFKGAQAGTLRGMIAGLSPVALIALAGGAAWLIYKRLA
jgi:hypothetical protein